MGNVTTPRLTGGIATVEKYAKSHSFATEMEFARFLHDLNPSKSISAWRGSIQRWRKKDPNNTFRKLEVIDESNLDSAVSNITIYYDKTSDIYISRLTNELTAVKGEVHRQMKHAYSKDGKNLTLEEMSREFQVSPTWLIQYIKVNGWTHGMDIFTDAEIEDSPEDLLVNSLLESKRQLVIEKANKKYWKQIQKDAEIFNAMEEHWANEFKELLPKQVKATNRIKHIKKAKVKPYAVVLSPTDLHYGKGGWINEVGESYSLEEARSRLLTRTEDLIHRLSGKPEKIIVATGSDWFHVDNEVGQTTKGTQQDMSASPAQILMDGCKLAREHIDLLRQVCPVEVVFMRGNHDRHTSLALMMYLDAVYENTKDVSVIVSPKTRQYISWGNNLLGFTHGDGVKGVDLPAVMSTEQRKEWGKCEHHTWFHGHLHHRKLTETSGVVIVQLPSLAGADRWHYHKGYVMARPGLSAHLLDKQLGLIGNLFSPVV